MYRTIRHFQRKFGRRVDPLPPNAVRATSPRTTFNGLLKSFVTLHAASTIFPVKLTCPSAAVAGKALEKLAATNANIITFFFHHGYFSLIGQT